MKVYKKTCNICYSSNFIDSKAEDNGFVAYECWNCMNASYLSNDAILVHMNTYGISEIEAMKDLETFKPLTTLGRSVP